MNLTLDIPYMVAHVYKKKEVKHWYTTSTEKIYTYLFSSAKSYFNIGGVWAMSSQIVCKYIHKFELSLVLH